MNKTDLSEIKEKERRIRKFLEEQGYDAMILGRKDNFAWFTFGGINEVVIPSEIGFAFILIRRDSICLIAQVMDGRRVIEEELKGLEVEYIPLRWYETSREAKAAELIKGLNVISDILVDGAEFSPTAIQALHYPLTDAEIENLRRLGKTTEQVIRSVADRLRQGMTETEIAGMFLGEYGRLGIYCDVLLIGSDERISKYRHPYPSEKRIDRYVLLHPAVRKRGLHANVTRLLHFGPVPEETQRRYEAACRIEAASIAMCKPGQKFQDILTVQKKLYQESGFPEEWRNHFQGGITGYILADPIMAIDPEAAVSANQAYDWFITITGVKAEELSINSGDKREVCSVAGGWPTKNYDYEGQCFKFPQILIR